jgi:hypothetical protein
MAFDDRHTERFILIGCAIVVLTIALLFARDHGWSVVNVLLSAALGVVVLLVLVGLDLGVGRVLEWWTSRKR